MLPAIRHAAAGQVLVRAEEILGSGSLGECGHNGRAHTGTSFLFTIHQHRAEFYF